MSNPGISALVPRASAHSGVADLVAANIAALAPDAATAFAAAAAAAACSVALDAFVPRRLLSEHY